MNIIWYGHAAFLIEAMGQRVIIDPYRSPDCGGFGPIDEPADVVVVSHENDRYHSHLGQIHGDFEVVRALELTREGQEAWGIRFEAMPCFETPEKLPGDEVTVISLRAEGLLLVHLGDLGHALSEEECERIRGADVVLAAVGGPPTIELAELRVLLEAIAPRLVIPMHFYIPGKINLKIKPIEDFLEVMTGWVVERANSSSLQIRPESPTDKPRIVCLEPAR